MQADITGGTTGHGTSGSLRILLAEDETVTRMAALATLRRAGHDVVTAEDGPAAVAAASGGFFDLILMDLGLPGFDGDEAVRRIRARSENTNTGGSGARILMLTATATPGGLERCQNCGADGVLPKPLRLDTLEAALWGNALPMADAGDGFDTGVIAQMREMLPADRTAALIGKTAATLREYRAALTAAWAAGDRNMVGAMAHKVAGVSGQYGCAALRRAAQSLEAAAESAQDATAAFTALETAYSPALAYLDRSALEG